MPQVSRDEHEALKSDLTYIRGRVDEIADSVGWLKGLTAGVGLVFGLIGGLLSSVIGKQ